eukprot:2370364-Amphidinium_carterae.1
MVHVPQLACIAQAMGETLAGPQVNNGRWILFGNGFIPNVRASQRSQTCQRYVVRISASSRLPPAALRSGRAAASAFQTTPKCWSSSKRRRLLACLLAGPVS